MYSYSCNKYWMRKKKGEKLVLESVEICKGGNGRINKMAIEALRQNHEEMNQRHGP